MPRPPAVQPPQGCVFNHAFLSVHVTTEPAEEDDFPTVQPKDHTSTPKTHCEFSSHGPVSRSNGQPSTWAGPPLRHARWRLSERSFTISSSAQPTAERTRANVHKETRSTFFLGGVKLGHAAAAAAAAHCATVRAVLVRVHVRRRRSC